MLRFLGLAMCTLALCLPAWPQFTQRSGLTGIVTDQSGAVMPNVTVTLKDLDRGQVQSVPTNESGLYSFTNLTPGRYQVTIEQPGFRKLTSDPIQIVGQETARLNLVLQVGDVTETVEVRTAAPLLQTEEAVVGAVVDRNLIENLPMKGRNFTAVAVLSPNLSAFPRGNTGGTWSVGGHHVIAGVNYTVGGGGDNGFYMNGVNINDNWVGGLSYSPSAEAISEVRLDVANFSAATGRDVSTLQIATKGGTSEFHGTVFNYFQNSALNAWNPYSKALAAPGQKKRLLQRNQYGFNLGGPIFYPGKFNKDRSKLFFFVNYEGMRENTGGEDAIYRVPTDAERQGDFSAWLTRFPGDPNYLLWDPYSTVVDAEGNTKRTLIPNNDIRKIGRLNTQAQDLLNLYPKPNGYVNPSNPLSLQNYRTFQAGRNQSYRLDTRFDYRFSNNDNMYVSISRSNGKSRTRGGIFPELAGGVEDQSYLITANYARVFTPSLTNEFIFATGKGTMYNVALEAQEYMRRTDTLRNKYFKNYGSGPDQGFYAVNISGLPTVGYGEVFMASNPTLQFSDNVNWIRGRHQFKFGLSYFKKTEYDWDYMRSVNFTNTFSRAGSLDNSLGGDGLASFLMGIPTSMEQRYNLVGGNSDLNLVTPYWASFVDDKYQVTKNLTLNLGLRVELRPPQYSGNNYGYARVNLEYPGWQLEIPGRASGLPQKYLPTAKDFAPRIGIAYRMKGDLVLRASYGIFFTTAASTLSAEPGDLMFNLGFAGVPGYVNDYYDNSRYGVPDDVPYLKWQDIFPPPATMEIGTYPVSTGKGTGWFDYMATVYFQDKDSIRTPYYQRYLFEVQKGLGSSMAVSLSYTGGRGTRLPMWDNINQPRYRTGWPSTAVFNAARPNNNGRWADVWLLRHGLDSFYNAATIKFDRRLSRGLQFVSHYTFSKTVIEQDMRYNRWWARGEASFSHPHRFVTALTYEIPFGGSLPTLAKEILWGWQISAITSFESGNSLTPGNAVTSARDREPNRPNVSGNPNLSRGQRTFYRYFDTSVFSAPPQDVKGNAGMGIIRGPGMNNWDIALSKTFRPIERLRAEFRADFFNTFNHSQWSSINTTFDNRAGNIFGRVTGAREPRIMQFGLRLRF